MPSAQTLAQTLTLVADALAWPLLLLQADGRLLLANLAARLLLRQGAPLRLSTQRRVAPGDPLRCAEFQQALHDAACGQGPRLLRWSGPANGGHTSAMLSRLAGDVHAMPGGPTLLLALSMEGGRRTDLLAFAALHRLSPAETRVLERLALGEGSTRVAQALGVGASTVRSQTLSLRRKTGHASVAKLLQTLAGLPPLALPRTPAGATTQGE